MNQIMKTGFFGGGSDAGGAISGAAYLHTIGKTNISSINRNEAIYTFIYVQMCDGPQYDYIFSMFDKCGDFDCFHFRYLRNARNIFKSNFERWRISRTLFLGSKGQKGKIMGLSAHRPLLG